MTYRLVRKNIIRLVVKKFHEQIEDTLHSFPNSYSKHEFTNELEEIANKIKKENKSCDYIDSIRKSLKGVRKEMIKVLDHSLKSNKVNKELFFKNYYGGELLDTRASHETMYDKVIEFEPGNTTAWVFAISPSDEVNYSQIQSEVEHDFGKECSQVLEKFGLKQDEIPTKDFESNEESNEIIDATDDEPEVKKSESQESVDEGWISNRIETGRVIFDKRNSLKLNEERKKWNFTVLIQNEFADKIWPHSTVAVYGKIKDDTTAIPTYRSITFFAKLGDGEKNSRHTAEDFTSYSYLHSEFKAYPLMQKISSSELGEFNVSNLSGFKVGEITNDEILMLYGMKKNSGIVYGNVIRDGRKITARFPYDATNDILKTTFYQSKHFLGRMNTGKTTALKWDFMITATSPAIPESERPIFIFIDGQGNFTQFPKIENLNDDAREFCNTHGITNPKLNVLTFSNNANRGDTTLGLDQLPVASWIYMLAEAAANTEGTLLQELDMARETIIRQQLEVNMTNIRREVENRVNGNPQINFNIRNAITRVLSAPETNLFDQQNRTVLTPELLFQPGRSLTLDVSNLNFNDRRAVVAYVAEMLHHHKFVNGRHHPPVILVLDEAEQIVPARGTEREKYNISRLSGRLAEITENGRQNYYGIYFVTHHTSKVNPDLVNLANTQICFKPSADDAKFIKKYFPEIQLDEVLKLNTGEFWMKTFFSTKEQPEILAKCMFPDLSEK